MAHRIATTMRHCLEGLVLVSLGLAGVAIFGFAGPAGAAAPPAGATSPVALAPNGPGLAGAALAPQAPSSLTTPSTSTATVELGDDAAKVTLANGQKWELTVGWLGISGAPSLALDLARVVAGSSAKAGTEEHSWQMNASASDFSFNASTGVGTLNLGTQGGTLATVDVTFTSSKTTSSTCVSGSEKTYTGKLTGNVKLATDLTPAGTITLTGASFDAYPPKVTVDNDCTTPNPPCANSSVWATGTKTTVPQSSGGNIVGTTSEAGVEQTVSLTSPADAVRLDLAAVTSAAPTWDPSTKVLGVTTSTGIVTGSGSFTGGKELTFSEPCMSGSQSDTLTTVENTTAKFASPAGEAITAHTALTGKLAVAAHSSPGFYAISTF